EAACDGQPADRLIAPNTLQGDTLAALFHTGGTTGLPKLAKHTHRAPALMAWSNTLMFDLRPDTGLLNPPPQFPVRRFPVRWPAPDRHRLALRLPGASGPAQSHRGARLLEHRRAQSRHYRGRGADHAGRDHERTTRGPRPLFDPRLRHRRLDRAGRAHPPHR